MTPDNEGDNDNRAERPVNCPECGEAVEVKKTSEANTWQMHCTNCGYVSVVKRSALGIFYTDENQGPP